MIKFEKQWLEKFSKMVTDVAGPALTNQITKDSDQLLKDYSTQKSITWTQQALDTLKKEVDLKSLKDIMTGCACHYPHEKLEDLKKLYLETKDTDLIHSKLQEQFIKEIKSYKQLSDEQLQFIINRGWGLAGNKEGNIIYATKIPSKFHEYFQATNPLEKASCYCHCSRIREGILNQEKIPVEYCYCGAGFYQDMWQTILMKKVDVEIVQSILKGDEVCQIKISI